MALVKRGSKRYLVRSLRVGGRVTSRCEATGERAEELHQAYRSMGPSRPTPKDPVAFAAWCRRQVDRSRREVEAKARREARREFERARGRAEAIEARVAPLAVEARTVADLAMKAAGFHAHRWAYRKRRVANMTEIEQAWAGLRERLGIAADAPMPTLVEVEAELATRSPDRVRETIDRWEEYDRRNPGLPSAVASAAGIFAADPAREVVDILLAKWSGRCNDVGRELLERQYARMLADLLGPAPTAIEQHLSARVMVAWLDLQIADRRAIKLDDSSTFEPAEKAYFQRTRDRAHKRYLDTLRSLSLVRNRALPALRLSVAVQDGQSGSSAAAVVEAGRPDRGPDGRRECRDLADGGGQASAPEAEGAGREATKAGA